MRAMLAYAAAALSGLVLLAWLWIRRPDEIARAHARNDAAPPTGCAAPLGWRVARADARFGLGEADVARAAERAAALWNGAAGDSLFRHDAEAGFPIRLSYDERQERAEELRAAERALQASLDSLHDARAAAASLEARAAGARARFDADERALAVRIAVHNDSVRAWNTRGGAPPGPAAALLAEGDALDSLRAQLESAHAATGALVREAGAALADVDRRERAHDTRARQVQRRLGITAVEGARYSEVVFGEGEREGMVQREIRVWRFDDAADLERVLAHELGHALGLGHAAEAEALMSERHHYATRPHGAPALDSADVALLRERCPRWFETTSAELATPATPRSR